MSYCRWSTDLFRCDVYVYEHVGGGWTTHVAGRRLRHVVPPEIVAMPWETGEQWFARDEAYRLWRESLPCDEMVVNVLDVTTGGTRPSVYRYPKDSEYDDLPAPEAGQTYSDETPGACADRLDALRAKGFRVPQEAIDALRAEVVSR